jgi:hypothetical protein
MPEISDHRNRQESDEPFPDVAADIQEETDAREATELKHVRSNYQRASSSREQGSSTRSQKPTTLLERLVFGISRFYRHQISVTVPHDKCRDHLGKFYYFSHVSSLVSTFPCQHYGNSSLIGRSVAFRRVSPCNRFLPSSCKGSAFASSFLYLE